MPRRGENIYKRKDGRWEARVLNTEGRYAYVYAKTYKEVKNKKKTLQDCVKSTTRKHPELEDDVSSQFKAWLEGDLSGRVKPSTYESYYICLTKYMIPFFQEKGNVQINEHVTAEFVKHICSKEELSASYKRKILSIFKTALREILKGSAQLEPVMNAVTLPKTTGADVQAFTMKEQRQIEKTVIMSHDKQAIGILLCFYTGIRLGEICALRWCDIDFEAGTMSVTHTVSRIKNFTNDGGRTKLWVGTPKSQRSVRKIPLPGFLLELLDMRSGYAFNENDYVLSGSGTPMEPRSYQKLFQTILQKAGVRRRKFHAIRHTFATRALELGVDIKTLSEILGHSNVSITLNIYAHSMFEQKKKAIDKLNAMYVAHSETTAFAVACSVVNS